MPETMKVYKECYHCHGAGEVPAYTDPEGSGDLTTCPVCQGTKWIEIERINADALADALVTVITKLNQIIAKLNE